MKTIYLFKSLKNIYSFGGNTSIWAKMTKKSLDAVLRDVQDFIEKSILEKEAGRPEIELIV